jgi:hypothetical protein
MQDRAKPSSEALRHRRPHDDDRAQQGNTPYDQRKGGLHHSGKKPNRAESGILRELAEEQRHLD